MNYWEDYDSADWWKGDETEEVKETAVLTETEKKIAHYEKRARYHWHWWKEFGDRRYLYYYRQANIKIRKLKGEYPK